MIWIALSTQLLAAPISANAEPNALGAGFRTLDKVISQTIVGAPPMPGSSVAPTRGEFVMGLSARVELLKPFFRGAPVRKSIRNELLLTGLDANQQAALKKLVEGQFVDPYGPLATLPTMNAKQTGRVVGGFLCRIADLTHQVDFKYSPYLGE